MEIDFAIARQRMVDNQIRTTDVTAHELLDSLLSVPREAFVPEDMVPLAYIDTNIKLGASGRSMLEPSPLAKLLQAAEVTSTDNVLEVGTGTGYVSAVLSSMADQVTALEVDPELAEEAKANLAEGYNNVSVVTGALAQGHKANGPFDVIFINGAIEIEPASLFDQLADGGRLIAVLGHGLAAQAFVFQKENNAVSSRKLFNSAIPALPGFERVEEFVF
ncbi:MAG: protein-L-isoaspartate O-methyltransferase [Rhizobiaceae bacterium]|nr:protein-L-isoaspartate O-methyltransferase [Rhizobiaceae bacterium]